MNPIVLVALFLLLYMFMIKPQQKRQRDARALLSQTSVGDRVLLTSGIYGVVLDANGDVLKVGLSPDVHLFVARAAVSRRVDPSDELSPPAFMMANDEDLAGLAALPAPSDPSATFTPSVPPAPGEEPLPEGAPAVDGPSEGKAV